MGRHHQLLFVAAVLALAGCREREDPAVKSPGWELKPPAADATPVSTREKMPGLYPAGSRIKDREALGGFGPCDNFPNDLTGQPWGSEGAVSLVAFPDESVAYFKNRGFALRVINRGSEAVPFAACDSMLFLIREAQDTDGQWREIESLRPAICGNSFHRVFLGANQYWEFPARQYDGPMKTKLRFRLDPGGGLPPIYSNEFDAAIHADQFNDR